MTSPERWCYRCKDWKAKTQGSGGYGGGQHSFDKCPTCGAMLGFERNKLTDNPQFLKEYGGAEEHWEKELRRFTREAVAHETRSLK